MLNPAFALVSMNMTLSSFDLLSPSSVDTCLQRVRRKHQALAGCISLNKSTGKRDGKHRSPLVDKISFVTNEHNDHITTPLGADFVDPF